MWHPSHLIHWAKAAGRPQEARRSRSKPDRGLVRGLVEVFNNNNEAVLTMRPMNLIRCRTPLPVADARAEAPSAAGRADGSLAAGS